MNGTGKQPPAGPAKVWGRLNPFARKSERETPPPPIRDHRTSSTPTAANGKAIKDTNARAQAGIKLASTRPKLPTSTPLMPVTKPPWRSKTAQQATTRIQNLGPVVGNIDQYKASNQTEIRFKPGQTVPNKNAKNVSGRNGEWSEGASAVTYRSQGFSSGKAQTAITNPQRRWPVGWYATWC